jgi:hypothetical protein
MHRLKHASLFLVVSSLFFLMSLLVIPLIAHAQATIPLLKTCNFNFCSAGTVFSGTQHGELATIYVPNLTLTGSSNLTRNMLLDPNESNKKGIIVGVEYNGSHCGVTTGSFYWEQFDPSGSTYNLHCVNFGQFDAGNTATIGASYYTSNGGGSIVWIKTNTGTGGCNSGCFVAGGDQKYLDAQLLEVFNGTFTGTEQGKWHWTNNQYFSVSLNNWVYQSAHPTPAPGNPVQQYWDPAPNGSSNHGGSLASCIKESGTTC